MFMIQKALTNNGPLNHPTKTHLVSGQGSRVASGKTRIFQSTSAGFDMFESQSHLSTFLSAASLLDLTVSNWLTFQINLVISKTKTRNRKRYHCCWSHVGLLSSKLLHSAFLGEPVVSIMEVRMPTTEPFDFSRKAWASSKTSMKNNRKMSMRFVWFWLVSYIQSPIEVTWFWQVKRAW